MSRLPHLDDLPQELDEDAFWALFGQIEYEQLDFKASTKHLHAAIASMAMTDGGFLILGVEDKTRRIVGRSLSQKTLDDVKGAGHRCSVDLQAREITVGGVAITVVAVPEVRGRIVTTPDGRLMRRLGSESVPLVGDAMARFVRDREERTAVEDVVPTLDVFSNFDLALVNAALEGDGRPRTTRRNLRRALVDLGVAEVGEAPLGTKVTKAALLLFADDPREQVPAAAVQVVRREGVGPNPGTISARHEFAGPIPRVVEYVLEFLQRHTEQREAVVGAIREPFPEYPMTVLREAVLNALAHRDYGLAGATVDITIWDDRIEVRSPGPLPGHITLDNMREEHYSRNPSIMKVLKSMRLVEEYGEGVDRMYQDMEARLMEPPSFTADGSVTVTLYNRSLIGVEDQAWLALLGHLDLSPQERRLLVLARHERSVTRRRLREVVPDADAEALLSSAVAKGLLVRVGQRGGARYVLSDEVVLRAGESGVEARSRKRQMLYDEIQRRGSLSTNEAMEVLDESDRSLVRHLLNDLVRSDQIVAEGKTRGRRYYAAA